ncbi:alpha-galactosidase [Microbacterium rhizophilus]|uniref:alpha-galactosidase n=1 Tax=Microbacterium rhizophilus TaxID=3138934 RepID=UPI0031EC4C42
MDQEIIRLADDGVAVLLQVPADGLPRVLHWGADPGDLSPDELAATAAALSRQTAPGTLDAAWQLSLLPDESDGWTGRPGFELTRGRGPLHPRWRVIAADIGPAHAVIDAVADGVELCTEIRLVHGIVTVSHEIGNTADAALDVHWLEATLPVPKRASHATTFSGRWTREKIPLTTPVPRGSVARQSRRGRPGHDNPTLGILSEGVPRNRSGEVWAVHVAWSGDTTYRTDRVTDAVQLLGAGELLRPAEMRLAKGERYRTPDTLFAHSDAGLDGLSARFHTWLRARPHHPRSPRPLVLNTWEAVYFDHDGDRLRRLADRAAQVGVERFVLDDGWFQGRRDDTTSLGDWEPDHAIWPDGLRGLAGCVHDLGMQFGLWFEPEMVSLDSDLARAHPDWLLHDPAHLAADRGLSWRTQYVLDLANSAAYAHVRDQMSALIADLGIEFIKWDHNRDLVESVHDGRPGTHEQTLAAYRLMDELRTTHPGLEIESCSSGGARTDLGVLAHTDRVWASDSNDPVERQDIQRWTQLMLPPELVGCHVGPTESHSSGRTTDLSFRLTTSLMGHAGFEWDLLSLDDAEFAAIAGFTALYRELRTLIHSGTAVHPDLDDPAWRVTGAVAPDRREAVFTVATIAALEDARSAPILLPGLDPDVRYRLRVREEIGAPKHGWITPEWLTSGEVVLPGAVLGTIGLQFPALWPSQAVVLHLTAVGPDTGMA